MYYAKKKRLVKMNEPLCMIAASLFIGCPDRIGERRAPWTPGRQKSWGDALYGNSTSQPIFWSMDLRPRPAYRHPAGFTRRAVRNPLDIRTSLY